MVGMIAHPCGQCLPCRIRRLRLWSWRQLLESFCHEESCFVTLTLDGGDRNAFGSVDPRALQLFLKRLRFACEGRKFRFFAVGEYGEQFGRPHYHLSLFGVSAFTGIGSHGFTDLVARSWAQGNVSVAEFNGRTAAYVAGYVAKKLTESERVDGRRVEFTRMSLRPGLGADAMRTIVSQLRASRGAMDMLRQSLDVPSALRADGSIRAFGRYLRNRLRTEFGMSWDDIQVAKDEVSYARSVELCSLFKAALDGGEFITPKGIALRQSAQRVLQAEARHKIFKARDKL